ncbi:GNAT family N-acetyltransferase [Escherichia albertii]|nr:GNAT family N-acetyltransferase [Escherichia albertii]
MSDFYIKHISLSDISFFMSECEESAKNGHLHQSILMSEGNKLFEEQIRKIIRMNDSGQYTGHSILILHRKSDDRKVGILWLCDAQDLVGRLCIEIRLINITKSMRGKGGGSKLLSIALDEACSNIITAKCYPASGLMIGMLKRRGFDVMGRSESGSEFLCLGVSTGREILR